MTMRDATYMDIGEKVYTAKSRMPWVVSYIQYYNHNGNEVTWEDKPVACRMCLVIPKRSFNEGGRRKAGERIAEGSFCVVYTQGLVYMYKTPPPKKAKTIPILVDDTHDEIWLPEGHKYHGSNGPLY
tara:strand:- start:498 stop:878 length:381 start_codon:yes stop_codon:yes gene_type:complete